MAVAGVSVSVSPGGAVARGVAPTPSVLVGVGAGISTRAEISGVVINADGTVRETFGGPYSTWTKRFRLGIDPALLRWFLTPEGAALAAWLGLLYMLLSDR